MKGVGDIEHSLGTDINNNGYIDNDTVNTIFYSIKGGISNNGNLISLSLSDSIFINYEFTNLCRNVKSFTSEFYKLEATVINASKLTVD